MGSPREDAAVVVMMASNPKKSLNVNSPFTAPENELWATFTIARFLFPPPRLVNNNRHHHGLCL